MRWAMHKRWGSVWPVHWWGRLNFVRESFEVSADEAELQISPCCINPPSSAGLGLSQRQQQQWPACLPSCPMLCIISTLAQIHYKESLLELKQWLSLRFITFSQQQDFTQLWSPGLFWTKREPIVVSLPCKHTQTRIAIESGIETSVEVVRSQTNRCRSRSAWFLLHCSRPVGTVVTNRAASHQKED